MIRGIFISLLALASTQSGASQEAQHQNSDCAGFELGPLPPPPPPGMPASKFPDYREAHRWCRLNWCSLITALVPPPRLLASKHQGWSRFTILRTEAFFGDSYQLAIWEFPDGQIVASKWILPHWSATTEALYRFRFEHPNSLPPDASKSVPVQFISTRLSPDSEQMLAAIQLQIPSEVKQGMPAMDDRNYWISIQQPEHRPKEIQFYAGPNPKLSRLIFGFIQSVAPNTPNHHMSSDQTASGLAGYPDR